MDKIIQVIGPDAIGISGTNPRKHFNADAMAELEASIKKHGVIQPLLVRPVTWTLREPTAAFGWLICRNGVDFEEFKKKEADGSRAKKRFAELQQTKFLLVAGERRLRAARKVGLAEVPVLVRDLDDKAALEIQLVENLQRADLDPIEEAEGYDVLIKSHGYTVDELAVKVGKSKAYIYARLKLTACCPAVRKALGAAVINHSVALLIARIPDDELQKKALREVGPSQWRQAMPEKEARRHIHEHYMLRLKDAPFDTRAEDLVPTAGPCSTCPKRTGNQKELFPDVQNGDVCTDPACFARKKAAAIALKLAAAADKGQRVLTPEQSKKLFFDSGGLKGGTDFVQPEDRVTTLGWNWDKDWKQTLGKKCPPPVLAVDPAGELHELIPAEEARAALKASGLKPRKDTSSDGRASRAYQKRKTQFQRAAGLATAAMLPKLATLVVNTKDKRHVKLWTLLCQAAYHQTSIEEHAFTAKRRGLVKSQTESRSALTKLLKQTTRAEDLIALALELLLCAHWDGGGWSTVGWSAEFKALAALSKVDLKTYERQTAKPVKKAKKK